MFCGETPGKGEWEAGFGVYFVFILFSVIHRVLACLAVFKRVLACFLRVVLPAKHAFPGFGEKDKRDP
jgi:hypothetical protein